MYPFIVRVRYAYRPINIQPLNYLIILRLFMINLINRNYCEQKMSKIFDRFYQNQVKFNLKPIKKYTIIISKRSKIGSWSKHWINSTLLQTTDFWDGNHPRGGQNYNLPLAGNQPSQKSKQAHLHQFLNTTYKDEKTRSRGSVSEFSAAVAEK